MGLSFLHCENILHLPQGIIVQVLSRLALLILNIYCGSSDENLRILTTAPSKTRRSTRVATSSIVRLADVMPDFDIQACISGILG